MKKILSLLAALALIFGCAGALAGCKKSEKYPAVESTAEEAAVVLTFPKADGGRYEVRYELFRALYLSLDREEMTEEEAKAAAAERCAEIYAVLALAEEGGFDPYSKECDEKVKEMIASSVEGGDGVAGFGGDYDAYLASLKEMYLNYAAQDLLYRYSLAYEELTARISDAERLTEEERTAQSAAAKEFYEGSDSALVLLATLNAEYFSEKRAGEIRDAIAKKNSPEEVRNYVLGFTATTSYDANVGLLVGRHSFDRALYGEITEAAFALAPGETSRPILIRDGLNAAQYYILYRVEKSAEYYEENGEAVLSGYRDELVGEAIAAACERLLSGMETTGLYAEKNADNIRMD